MEIIKKVSRHVRDLSQGLPAADSEANIRSAAFWKAVFASPGLALGQLAIDGIAGVGTAQALSLAASAALKEIYDGENLAWRAFEPEGHLDPTNYNWIKDETDDKELTKE